MPMLPRVGIWGFQKDMQTTKEWEPVKGFHIEAGPTDFNLVRPRLDYGEPGGGFEATIFQPFIARGFFFLFSVPKK
jgi:hypothetical protein